MKVKVSYVLASFAATFLLAFSVQAQEELPVVETPDPTHREINLDEDKTLIYDHPSHTSTVRDSMQVVPRVVPLHTIKNTKPDVLKNNHKEEEDALSFNFLYYMFQKFKMSDLIDQE